jgi:hypothetical protein
VVDKHMQAFTGEGKWDWLPSGLTTWEPQAQMGLARYKEHESLKKHVDCILRVMGKIKWQDWQCTDHSDGGSQRHAHTH